MQIHKLFNLKIFRDDILVNFDYANKNELVYQDLFWRRGMCLFRIKGSIQVMVKRHNEGTRPGVTSGVRHVGMTSV